MGAGETFVWAASMEAMKAERFLDELMGECVCVAIKRSLSEEALLELDCVVAVEESVFSVPVEICSSG